MREWKKSFFKVVLVGGVVVPIVALHIILPLMLIASIVLSFNTPPVQSGEYYFYSEYGNDGFEVYENFDEGGKYRYFSLGENSDAVYGSGFFDEINQGDPVVIAYVIRRYENVVGLRTADKVYLDEETGKANYDKRNDGTRNLLKKCSIALVVCVVTAALSITFSLIFEERLRPKKKT